MVVSLYMPHDSPLPAPGPGLTRLIEFCERIGTELVIGTDSNAHNQVWGSSDTNGRGVELLQYVATTDLLILNRGRKPTFANASREEVIDLTLATRGIADRVPLGGW